MLLSSPVTGSVLADAFPEGMMLADSALPYPIPEPLWRHPQARESSFFKPSFREMAVASTVTLSSGMAGADVMAQLPRKKRDIKDSADAMKGNDSISGISLNE